MWLSPKGRGKWNLVEEIGEEIWEQFSDGPNELMTAGFLDNMPIRCVNLLGTK